MQPSADYPQQNIPPPVPPPLTPQPDSSLESRTNMLEQGEQIVDTIRRHPIGLVVIYVQALGGLAAIVALAVIVAPDFLQGLSGSAYTMLTIASVLLLGLVFFILMLVTSIYRQNKLVITNKGIIQTLQSGPFHKKTSRLSMADVEDVTVDQKGILPTSFGYGILNVETAGELRNFVFPYAPNPNEHATKIVQARQAFSRDQGGH